MKNLNKPTDDRTEETGRGTAPRQDLSKWLPSPGNVVFTLLAIALLVLTQQVWANPTLDTVSSNGAGSINYQGRLAAKDGSPITDSVGMSFSIWDAETGGGLIWGPENHSAVKVSDGLFNVGIGSIASIQPGVWNGDRYLEISVAGEKLSPRELIRSVPFAGMALTVPDRSISSHHMKPILGKALMGPKTIGLTKDYQTLASTSVSVKVPSSVFVVATGDFNVSNGGFAGGLVIVDGVIPAPGTAQGLFLSGHQRASVSNNVVLDLDPGTHTISLVARNVTGTGTAKAENHTGFSYFIVAQD